MSEASATGSLSHEAASQQAIIAALKQAGAPYPQQNAILGGVPNTNTDIPLSAVFIAVFLMLGLTHMTIFQINRKRGNLFFPSSMTFGFCSSRITTFIMRIVWAKHQKNTRVSIAAAIFLSAGVIVLCIINMIYAQRLLREEHPRFGGKPIVNRIFITYYCSVIGILVMVVTSIVLSFYTLDITRLRQCRDIQRVCIIYLLIFCILPVPIVLLSRLFPSPSMSRRPTHKMLVVLTAAALLTLSTGFRTGVTFSAPRPMTNPAWYHGTAAFYCFVPLLEVCVVVMFAAARVDRMFSIPKAEKGMEEKGAVEVDTSRMSETDSSVTMMVN